MTRSDLIEKMARAMSYQLHCDQGRWRDFADQAEAALSAILPEGEAWIAPMVATGAMKERACGYELPTFDDVDDVWAAMRDAYLKPTPPPPR